MCINKKYKYDVQTSHFYFIEKTNVIFQIHICILYLKLLGIFKQKWALLVNANVHFQNHHFGKLLKF